MKSHQVSQCYAGRCATLDLQTLGCVQLGAGCKFDSRDRTSLGRTVLLKVVWLVGPGTSTAGLQ